MAIDQDITNLPTPPSRSDSPSDFSDKADTFLAALPQLQTELNTYADEANSTQVEINLSESNAADSEQTALEWASKTDGQVETVDFSAKAYAISDNLIPEGAAKEWAIKIGGTVDGTEFSAKKYAIDAESSANAAASIAGATAWSAGVTYDTNDAAIGSDGNTYRSLVDGNLGNDPVAGDGTKWLNLTGTADVTKAELTKTFAAGESASLTLSEEVTTAPVVSVTKEVPQTGVTSNDWDVASDGANYTLHDTAYDTTLTPNTVAFNLGAASYDSVSFYVGNLYTDKPQSVTFSNDGSKMYVVGGDFSQVSQYTLSTSFDLSTASYDNLSFDVSLQESNPSTIIFNDDGTKMYIAGTQSKSVQQYSLSTSFDLSTASYDSVSYDVSGQDSGPQGITFNNDGTKMYMIGYGNNNVFQYTLGTAFDISTASYDSISFDPTAQVGTSRGITFNNDGSKLYIVETTNNSVFEYTLSTAFDVSTASYDSVFFDVSEQDDSPTGIVFNTDGTKMYMIGQQKLGIYQYTTSTSSFVLGTGSFASADVGKRIVGNGGEAILTATDGSYELQTAFNDTSTIAAGDWSMFALDVESADAGLTLSGLEIIEGFLLDQASYDTVSFNVSGQDASPFGIAFNTDGTKMYMIGSISDYVYQYTLSTAFDVSTASYDNLFFDPSVEFSDFRGLTFNNDGTKMYLINGDTDSVLQYSLSTAFDLSTVSYDNASFSYSAQDTNNFGITFSQDGSKMHILGFNGDFAHQYTLSTPFEVSTASFDNSSIDFSGQDGERYGMAFNTDGTKFYLLGNDTDSVYQYSVIKPFDITTASYDNISFSVSGQETSPTDIAFSADGTKMYVVGSTSGSVHQYTIGSFNYFIPTAANHTAITTSSIDSEFWTDINSMTADDSVNDGAVYYAVSTDDRTTWSIIDDTEGVRNIVRNNAGTWEVNDASDYGTETWVAATENDEFYALEEAVDSSTAQSVIGFAPADQWSYDSVSFSVAGQETTPRGITFNNDGSKMYITGSGSNSVFQYSLSTAFDISTASYENVALDISPQDNNPTDILFNTDGTKMFIVTIPSDNIFEYVLSVPFDVGSASYNNSTFTFSTEVGQSTAAYFNLDGSKLYVIDSSNQDISEYSLSSAFDLSSISYNNVTFDISSAGIDPEGLLFNNDGTKLYVLNKSGLVSQYSMPSAFDLSNASFDNVTFDVSSEDGTTYGFVFNEDGTRIFVTGNDSDSIYQYSTGTPTSTNRMDATQLNAVSDTNHYTLGNDLDLAITLFMADGNTNSPTSDGVSINYDANVLNQGAVLGTDYEFDKPANDTVRIKALSNENFKVRVV